MNKMVVAPLVVLLMVSVFGFLLGYDSSGFGAGALSVVSSDDCYVDVGGHQCCYLNGTAVGEAGYLDKDSNWAETEDDWWDDSSWWTSYDNYWDGNYVWVNATGSFNVYIDYGQDLNGGFFDIANSTIGFLGITAGLMALACLIGWKLFGNGLSEFTVKTVVLLSAYLGLFVVCSMHSASLLWGIPVVGVIVYFLLTFCYTMGMLNSL